MRILLYLTEFPAAGVTSWAVTMAARLRELGHDVVLFAGVIHRDVTAADATDGPVYAGTMSALVDFCNEQAVDVLHMPAGRARGYRRVRARLSPSVRVVTTDHGIDQPLQHVQHQHGPCRPRQDLQRH